MRTWTMLTAGTAALVGIGAFLAVQGSGKATEYATIASFFLAIPMAAASIVALADARSKSHADAGSGTTRSGQRSNTTFIRDSGVVMTGKGSRADVNITYGTSDQTGPRQRKAPKRRRADG